MNNDNDILKQIDRRSGMTVPDNYFADFSARMMDKLPQKEPVTVNVVDRRSVWQRCRPYIYLAAMFCGIWLMMWIFNDLGSRAEADMTDNPVIAGVLGTDQFYEYYPIDDINEYVLMEDMYDEGVTLVDFKQ